MKNVQHSSASTVPTSSIVFYSINRKSIKKMSFQKVWNNYALKPTDNVRCVRVVNYKWQKDVLIACLKDKTARHRFLSDVKREYDADADYMFVPCGCGEPIVGFHIETFIDSCEE